MKRSRLKRAFVAGAAACLAAMAMTAIVPQAANAGPVYQVIDADNDPYTGIYLRNGTSMANVDRVASRYIVYGNSVDLLCGTWGEAVGPYANRRWHNVRVLNGPAAGQTGWVADRYTNTPNAANQPTPGEAECGAPPSGDRQRVWAGSPIDGGWDAGPPSPPSVHHFLGNPTDQGDWALDIGGTGDVLVYIAPDNGAPDVTTRVDQIGAACSGGANGAQFVTVGIYQSDGQRIGSAIYGHVYTSLTVGSPVNRWGGKVGTVATGLPYNSACWTGPHVHFQLYSNVHYACYNNTYAHEQWVYRSNFLGRTGGNVASGYRQPCA